MSAVEVRQLSFSYPKRRSPGKNKNGAAPSVYTARAKALDSVDLSVRPAEVFGLLGPNGGGKTTLFRILSTDLQPQTGSARIFGADVAGDPRGVRRQIGVVFQSPSLDIKLTVAENLLHQGHLYGLRGRALGSRIDEILSRMGLTSRADERAETLSGGLKRRVEVAKSLLHEPRLLLMDEPSTGLDPGARKDLWDHLAELKAQGITVCVTTHLMEEAEKCDRIAILNEGRVVALNTPAALKDEIGGDVITVETPDPETLAIAIRRRFHLDVSVVEGSVHIERERGHEFIPVLVQEYPNDIRSVILGKPSLEDVFIHRTGHKFWTPERPHD